MFTHLHAHSYFSLLEALPSPADLARAASLAGMPALALTDHNSLAGAVEFVLACQEWGVKPIVGMEVDVDLRPIQGNLPPADRSARLVLLATGRTGWVSLCRLCAALHLPPDQPEILSISTLAQHTHDLIAISGDQNDPTGRTLSILADLFPGRFYVELVMPTENDRPRTFQLAQLAHQRSLPVVATSPIACLEPGQVSLLRTLQAIRENRPIVQFNPAGSFQAAPCFQSASMLNSWFAGIPEALRATQEIAASCQLALPIGESHYPRVPLPPGQTPIQLLRQKAESGAHKLYGRVTPAIQARLDHELEVIADRRFESIFLIVEEIIHFARETGVPTSSRGSAASSLVAHCLGITSPDPLELDLYFERFLNPARSSPPDIDTDICSRRRDSVIQHVFDTYGPDYVAMVGTINRFRPRSALGDVAKAHGLPAGQIHEWTRWLPYHYFSSADSEEAETIPVSPFAELAASYRAPGYQAIFHEAEALLRLPRHLSVHAGGIVISPDPLPEWLPLQRSGSKGVVITQLDLDSVEQMGFLKLDLLGIRGLTVLGDVAEDVYSWRRRDFKTPLEVLETIPTDDPEIADRIEAGQTIGCFQIESPGMRATLREIRARSIHDIMVALSLYRPGPLKGGLRDTFVRRFKREEPIEHIHPALAPLLGDTFGVILYQEQVLRIAHEIAGLSLGDADLLRRAMSHFDPGKQMQHLKTRFIEGAYRTNDIPPEIAERVWELMAAFAGYGFPKAHAASYASVAWRSAWCKNYYPAEFMAAVLANWGGYYSQRVYLNEARRMGLVIRPPSINHSGCEFSVRYPGGEPVLYMGLDQVRDLTRRTQQRILHGRPFHSLSDFLTRVDPSPLEAENLISIGAFEEIGTIPGLLDQLQHGIWRFGQMSLFEWEAAHAGDWDLGQKVAAQQAILSVSLEAHPLELVADSIAGSGAISTSEAADRIGQRVSIAAIRQSLHRSRTAHGDTMAFLTIEDLEGTLDAILYPDLYHRSRAILSGLDPFLISGIIEMDPSRGEAILRTEKILPLGNPLSSHGRSPH